MPGVRDWLPVYGRVGGALDADARKVIRTVPGGRRGEVYQNATGLKRRPQPKGIGANGFFPAGVTNPGWVEIDDIFFVMQ